MAHLTTANLHDAWTFRQADATKWLPVRRVPTNVHLDLIDNQVIKDPFLDFNELDCQWVGEKSWVYRRILPELSEDDLESRSSVLVFDGLDTFATVKLNGSPILVSENMWHMHRVDVTDLLKPHQEAVLEIEFSSALLEARRIMSAHPDHRWVGFNSDMARLAVRKAQYHWGWDWGPILMTCGPWREVKLETYTGRLVDLHTEYEVDLTTGDVHGFLRIGTDGSAGRNVIFTISFDSAEVSTTIAEVESRSAKAKFCIKNAHLWYPNGYGKQALYTVTATLLNREPLDSISIKTGFRKAELVQEMDKIGRSFFFRLNGIDVFCGGSDWIPADSFTPRISNEKYRAWLQALADGNQVMIRVWGGGVWEHDVFYDTCDELGILVWQDFMFACGNYPAFPDFLHSVRRECITQTKRLRHHPALVVYAGNNEDYQVQELYKLSYDYEDKNPMNWLQTDFPARYIYEKLLPDVVSEHSAHVSYHPGSPWGDGKASSDPTVGDMHQWNVWHGTQEKYQIYDTLGGRFNSEFGMEAFPHIDTIEHFVSDKSQLFPQSHVIDFHNKAAGAERRLALYLAENLRIQSYELKKYIHLTQLIQAEALTYGYRGWRRQWGTRHCGGALVWQLNDCWPTISWSIIDYYMRKKPAYYALRRVLAPLAISIRRAHHDWSVTHAKPAKQLEFECWVASSRAHDVVGTIEVRFVSVKTGEDIKKQAVRRDVMIKANTTTDVLKGSVDNEREEAHVLAARLWIEGEIVSRDIDWPQPLKYLDMAERNVQVTQGGSNRLSVKVARPTKGLVLEERMDISVSDSALDLVPGDEQEIIVTGLGLNDAPLQWTYLGADY